MGTRWCPVCRSTQRREIDDALRGGAGWHAVADLYGLRAEVVAQHWAHMRFAPMAAGLLHSELPWAKGRGKEDVARNMSGLEPEVRLKALVAARTQGHAMEPDHSYPGRCTHPASRRWARPCAAFIAQDHLDDADKGWTTAALLATHPCRRQLIGVSNDVLIQALQRIVAGCLVEWYQALPRRERGDRAHQALCRMATTQPVVLAAVATRVATFDYIARRWAAPSRQCDGVGLVWIPGVVLLLGGGSVADAPPPR